MEHNNKASIIDFEDTRLRSGDYMVRGTAADGQVRAFAIAACETVQTAHVNHGTTPLVTAALGRLMMGALMMGQMFKAPDELITLIVEGDGPIGTMTVTANCIGQVKGFATNPFAMMPLNSRGKLDVGGGVGQGMLAAVRDLPGEEPYSSQVELVSGEIAEDLTHYFVVSDQVPTSVGLGVLVGRDNNVQCAGGFVVQLMPGCSDEVADAVEANLAGIASVTDLIESGETPTGLLERVLDGLGYTELEVQPVEFYCGCNEDRALRSIIALGEEELRDIVEVGEPAEVHCHFCGRIHHVPVERIRELLDAVD